MTRRESDCLRIMCVLPRLRDSRIARRIDMLSKSGFAVEAIAFERKQDAGREPDCPVQLIGEIRHGSYISRIPRFLRAMPAVRRAMKRVDLVYAFNVDIALLALVAGNGLGRPVVLETADIRDIQVSDTWGGRIVRVLEKRVTERCSLLVLTADGYRTYYRNWLGAEQDALIIENKVASGFAEQLTRPPERVERESAAAIGPLRIGWFGILRDAWTWEVLRCLTNNRPEGHVAVLAGLGVLDDFDERVAGHPGVEYLGEYRSPDDLCRIYDSVDLTMACYPTEVPSRWSRSNRYYEACLFGKPLIVRAECADAERVARHDIGLVLDASDPHEAAQEIQSISAEDIERWRRNIRELPAEEYVALNEASELGAALSRIVTGQVRCGGAEDSEERIKIWKMLW